MVVLPVLRRPPAHPRRLMELPLLLLRKAPRLPPVHPKVLPPLRLKGLPPHGWPGFLGSITREGLYSIACVLKLCSFVRLRLLCNPYIHFA